MKNNDYKIGKQLALSGKYEDAMPFLKNAASAGCLDAINDLGVVFERLGDYQGAVDCYKMAALSNNLTAISNLGYMLQYGLGVEKDYNLAKQCFEAAISLGDTFAYFRLYEIYAYGQGVDVDANLAIELLIEGAEMEEKKGFPSTICLSTLGRIYATGNGVRKSIKKAVSYLKLAAEHGDEDAKYALASMELKGEIKTKNGVDPLSTIVELACDLLHDESLCLLADIYAADETNKNSKVHAGHILCLGADKQKPNCLLKIVELCLEGKAKDYGFTDSETTIHGILDYLTSIDGFECKYSVLMDKYNALKAKYTNVYDWEYLETLPDYKSAISRHFVC